VSIRINQYIEHTSLKPTITGKEVDQLVAEAKAHHFLGVCIPPFWVKRAKREIEDFPIKLVTVVGFPLGYQMTETKIEEIKLAMRDGADELDLVTNISALKSGMPWVKIEYAKCSKLIHDAGKIFKVIIETALLTQSEIVEASTMVADAGGDYVKTSTGFIGQGASVEHINLIRQSIPPTVGIKASGGINTLSKLNAMIDAGASRIGTSSGVAIMIESANA